MSGTVIPDSHARRVSTHFMRVLGGGTLACTLALFSVALYVGDVNQDEGWYLYAAREIARGRRLYVDFASTQGPLMPHVYAWAYPFWGPLGVAGGRLVTAAFGLAVVLGSAWLAARLVPSERRKVAWVLGLALAGINVHQCYFFTVVKTYALCSFLLTGGFLFLTSGGWRGRWWSDALAGVLWGAAAGARVSAVGVPLAVVLTWLVVGWRGRHPESQVLIRRALVVAAASALTCALLYVPFAVQAPQALWFALFEYHAGRATGGWLSTLAYKAGFISRLIQAWFVPMALGLIRLVLFFTRPVKRSAPSARRPVWTALWTAFAAVTGLHVLAPFPYDDYQAIVFPLFSAAVAASLSAPGLWDEGTGVNVAEAVPWRGPNALAMAVFLLCAIAAWGSPLHLEWFVARRDRIWWPIKREFPLSRLRRVGRFILSLPGAKPGSCLLTQDLYLAVETEMQVPAGMELGPFCYFPEWSDEKAKVCRVLNRRTLREILSRVEAPVAAFSGYGLAIRCPEVMPLADDEHEQLWRLVYHRYRLVSEVADFGQAATRLAILIRSPAELKSAAERDSEEPRETGETIRTGGRNENPNVP